MRHAMLLYFILETAVKDKKMKNDSDNTLILWNMVIISLLVFPFIRGTIGCCHLEQAEMSVIVLVLFLRLTVLTHSKQYNQAFVSVHIDQKQFTFHVF